MTDNELDAWANEGGRVGGGMEETPWDVPWQTGPWRIGGHGVDWGEEMSLIAYLYVNDTLIGQLRMRRSHGAVGGRANCYEVHANSVPHPTTGGDLNVRAEVTHDYNDNPWELVRKSCEAVLREDAG